MAERKQSGKAAEDEEVPAFFKNLGSGSPKPRQKFCGMFCPVEGSSENKTIDFDSLTVGRGSGQVVAQQRDVAHLGPDPQTPYSRQGRRAGGEPSVESSRKVEIRRASGKEALQNINDQVGMGVGGAVLETENRAWGSPLPRPLPARQRTEDPSVPTPQISLLAGAHTPHPARPLSLLGLGGGRPCVHKGCPRLPGPGRWRVGGKGSAYPRLGRGSYGWRGRGRDGFPFFFSPPGWLPIAAVAGCPTLFDAAPSMQWRVRAEAGGLPRGREGRGPRRPLPAAPCALSQRGSWAPSALES